MKPFEDFQKLSQGSADATMRAMGDWSKSWQSIAAEMTDYTKRSFEDGTKTLEKLLTAKSMEQAFEIQSTYAKRACDEYMHQLSKLGSMYAELAKEVARPFERVLHNSR